MDRILHTCPDSSGSLRALRQPYLLLTFIPWERDEQGRIWTDDLWCRDLLLHLDYIEHLILLAPDHPGGRAPNWVPLPPDAARRIELVSLPRMDSRWRALVQFPRIVACVWRTVGRAEIVHSGVVGWPFPLGWIANPIALMKRKKLILVIESSPWRAVPESSAMRRWRGRMFERVVTAFLDRADLCLFTSEAYKTSLLDNPRGKAIVTPASWIETSDIIGEKDCVESWEMRRANASPRFLCPSRLTSTKGIHVVLEAMTLLESRNVRCTIDFMGDGELKAKCRQMAAKMSSVSARVLEPVYYGAPFFEVLRRYDCILVPLVMDEQPRIIFDAYSQARPVLASATTGIRAHVIENVTGWLVCPGDPVDLADRIAAIAADMRALPTMGDAARRHASAHTHEMMHRKRWASLLRLFGDGSRPRTGDSLGPTP